MSRKGENIYKRKDKRWEARFIKGYSEDGRARYGYLYAESYHEARAKLEKAKVSLAIGESINNMRSACFYAYCDEWLTVNKCKISESTHVKYSVILNKHIKPYLGGMKAESINNTTVSKFTDHLKDKGISSKTVRDVLTVLGSVLKYAKRRIGVKMQEIEIVYPRAENNEMRVLSRSEQEKLVSFLIKDTDVYKFGILLALMTGMRIGELCALRWEDVNFEERCIHVLATMQRLKDPGASNTRVIISTPKSKKSARTIPLTDYALALCRSFCVSDAGAFVLTGDAETYCEPRKLQYRFKKITEELGLSGVHFHSLRHTFATRCVEVGFEIKSLSEILGHASPKITLERYVHSSIELKRDNMKKLAIVGF